MLSFLLNCGRKFVNWEVDTLVIFLVFPSVKLEVVLLVAFLLGFTASW